MYAVEMAFSFFVPVLFILIYILIAVEFSGIAELKGHYSKKYLVYSIFFGPVGWLMVIALPDRQISGSDTQSFQKSKASSTYGESSYDRKTLLKKRAAADSALKSNQNLSAEQRKHLQNLIAAIDRKLGN